MKTKVLIIKMGFSETLDEEIGKVPSLGDVLRTTPILWGIREKFPDSHISWLTSELSEPLLKGNPFIDRLLVWDEFVPFQLMREKFDVLINLEKIPGVCAVADMIDAWIKYGFRFDGSKGTYHSYERGLDFITYIEEKKMLNKLSDYWQKLLIEMLGVEWKGQSYVIGYRPESKEIHDIGLNYKVGSKWPSKAMSIDKWKELELRLKELGYSVSWQEGLDSLNDYMEWINSCRILISQDSLGLHLALAFKKKLVALWGPTNPQEIYPYGETVIVKSVTECDKMPCYGNKCATDLFCMENIPVGQILNGVVSLLLPRWANHINNADSLPSPLKTLKEESVEKCSPKLPTLQQNHHRRIILVADRPLARVAKIACALRAAGREVTLLYGAEPNFDISEYVTDSARYQSADEALYLAQQFPNHVFHIFAHWDFAMPMKLIQGKPGKMLFDTYDMLAGMFTPRALDQNRSIMILQERFCLENADGIVCRCLELQVAKHRHHYHLKGRRLFFPDFCWNNNESVKAPPTRDNIHLVYCGNLTLEKYNPESPFCFHLWLGQLLARQKVHYHIYPGTSGYQPHLGSFEEVFSDYMMLAAQTPYFHIHPPCSNETLIAEMSNYHLGLLILSRTIEGVEYDYTHDKYQTCIGNKIFDYFDAGLPVITHSGKFTNFMANRYGGAITATQEMLHDIVPTLQDSFENGILNNAGVSRNQYSVHRHIPRLMAFYDSF